MPDSYTTNIALIKPEIGASRDSWGSKTNTNWDTVDQLLSMAMPIGTIIDFAGPTAPSGWLIADGRLVSRVTYAKLFAVVGVYWGAGDGSTTFGLPNMNGRSGVGPGTFTDESGASYTLGFTSLQGFVTRTITQAYLPNYTLTTDGQGYHTHTGATVVAGSHTHVTEALGTHNHGGNTAPGADHTHTGSTDFVGDHAHGYDRALFGSGSLIGGSPAIQVAFFTSTTGVAGAHSHAVTTAGSGNLRLGIYDDGYHAHNVLANGDHNHAIAGDGIHAHYVNLGGGGTSLKTLSPIAVVTKIIYAGSEAAIVTAADIAAAPTSPDTHQEIENLREEIAALRSLFETPRARMLSAPSRGPH